MYRRIVIKLSGEALTGMSVDDIKYREKTNDVKAALLENLLKEFNISGNSNISGEALALVNGILKDINRLESLVKSSVKRNEEELLFDIANIISGRNKNLYDTESVNNVCRQLIELAKEGTQVSLVVGGGNILRGRSAAEGYDRVKADYMGMLATVINSIFLSDSIAVLGGKAVVLTPFPIGNMTELYYKDKTLSYMEEGIIPIFAGGLGHPFFSTDTIPALRASELKCDCVLFAKSVDGVYDSDPKDNPNAKKFSVLTYNEMLSNNYRALDVAASAILRDNKISSSVFALNEKDSLIRACRGEEGFGTRITV